MAPQADSERWLHLLCSLSQMATRNTQNKILVNIGQTGSFFLLQIYPIDWHLACRFSWGEGELKKHMSKNPPMNKTSEEPSSPHCLKNPLASSSIQKCSVVLHPYASSLFLIHQTQYHHFKEVEMLNSKELILYLVVAWPFCWCWRSWVKKAMQEVLIILPAVSCMSRGCCRGNPCQSLLPDSIFHVLVSRQQFQHVPAEGGWCALLPAGLGSSPAACLQHPGEKQSPSQCRGDQQHLCVLDAHHWRLQGRRKWEV